MYHFLYMLAGEKLVLSEFFTSLLGIRHYLSSFSLAGGFPAVFMGSFQGHGGWHGK